MTNDDKWIGLTIVWFVAVGLIISINTRKPIPKPISKKSYKELIEAQGICSSKAEEYFKNHYFAESEKSNHYTSYFNRKLEKCFVLVNQNTWGRKVNYHTIDLIEVFEDRVYGRFRETSGENEPPDKNKSLAPALPQECWAQDKDEPCKDIREFIDKYVSSYMKG